MKGFTKICLIVSLIFVCVGAACLCAGAALGSGLKEVWAMAGNGEFQVGDLHIGGWNVPYIINTDEEGFSEEELEIEKGAVKESFSAQEIENLEINIRYGAVYVTDSETDQIEIAVNAPKKNAYQCKKEGNTLKLVDKTSRYSWNALYRRLRDKVEIMIAIPQGTVFDEVELTTDAGGIEISHAVEAKKVRFELDAGELIAGEVTAEDAFSVETGAGNLEIAQFTTEYLDVDCGVGKTELHGEAFKEVEAKCGVGQIVLDLKGEEDDYDYEISCGLGSVRLNGKTYSTLSTEKEIDHHAGRKIELECGVGEIEVTVKEEI